MRWRNREVGPSRGEVCWALVEAAADAPGSLWSPGMGPHGFHVNNKPSIGAFYSASSTFVGWLAQRTHMRHWIRQDQHLHAHSTWTAGPLVDLKAAHRCLIQEYKCVEAAPDAAPAAAGADASPHPTFLLGTN